MFEYIAQHPLSGVAIVLLLILTVFVCFKAVQSGNKRNAEREKIIKQIEYEKSLRNEFRTPDDSTFDSSKDDFRLIEGMCAFVQMKIEKSENLTKVFNELSVVWKDVYCLGYVFTDGKNKMSEFFRMNGEPLLSASKDAVERVIGGDFSEMFNAEFDMFDENNEDVSVDNTRIEKLDGEISSFLDINSEFVYSTVAEYIRANKSEFII